MEGQGKVMDIKKVGIVAIIGAVGAAIYFLTRKAVAKPALAGLILNVKWRETGTEEWHPFPISVPENTPTDIKWKVRNDSNLRATFTTGIISLDKYRLYPQTLTTIAPGEVADLIKENFPGHSVRTGSQTFYLAALAGEVLSIDQPDWYDAALVDMVTIQYTYY